ncbi:zinc-binding metallopeptidase family protein [Enterovibrio coralii]|uniref:hypothetical protein n=1 Tax=Enterovibrio coralii TaxID=294935 RepID=UPI000A7D10AE|nr:hypothetical protein [Enterovibrio coralii]
MKNIEQQLIDNFKRYVAISSQSDGSVMTLPSSEGQRTLAKLLCDDLNSLGYQETELLESGIALVRLPGNLPDAKKIGFIAHLDTVDVGLSQIFIHKSCATKAHHFA